MKRASPLLLALSLAACGKRAAQTDGPAPCASANAPPPAPSATAAPSASASAAPSARAPLTACPYVLAGKPSAWKARVLSARTPAALAAALGEIGASVPDPGSNAEGQPRKPWEISAVRLSPVPLAGKAPDDYWAEIRFSQVPLPEEAGGQGVASAALVKQPDGAYCALPGPADAQAFSDHACLGGPEEWPIAFALHHIVDKDRMTVVAHASHGQCGGGCRREGHADVQLLDVQGFELATVLSRDVFSAYYHGCPSPPPSWTHAGLEWIGPYPREIVVTDALSCSEPGMFPPAARPGPCTPTAEETRFAWLRDHYEPTGPARPLPAPHQSPVPLAEGGFDDGSGRAWGGRCFRRLEAGRLEDAETDCLRGLARATDANIRASLLYNLALIAERRGEMAEACRRAKESLTVRPGNAATIAKRDEVCR